MQDFLNAHLAELINRHVAQDSSGTLGQCLVELGRAETYVVRSAANLTGESFSTFKISSVCVCVDQDTSTTRLTDG